MKLALIFVTLETGYCGESATEVFTGKLPIDQPYNNEYAQTIAEQNAEQYGSDGENICCECGKSDDYCDCDGEDSDWQPNENVSYSLEIYCPDNHDTLKAGGGSFLNEFPYAVLENAVYYVDE